MKFKINDYVQVNGGYIGKVKKISIDEDGVTYRVEFHSEMNWKPYTEKEMHPVRVYVNPPSERDID